MALLDEENYRLRRELVHARRGETGATHFSVTLNDRERLLRLPVYD